MNAVPLAKAKISFAAWLLPIAAIALLAGHMSGAIACLSEHGAISLKPRDFTLGLSGLSLFLLLFNRPSFSPAALWMILIPFLRFSDSAVLKRYENIQVGDHSIAVMTLANILIVTVVAILVLCSEHGLKIAYRASIVIILLGTFSIVYEAAGYAEYTQIPGRPAGFGSQPNEAIIIMCLALGVALTLHDGFWGNVALIAIAAVGVGVTLSRSGILVFALMIMVYVLANLRRHFTKIVIIAAASVPAVLTGFAILYQMASSHNFGTDKNAMDRVEGITGMFSGSADKMESAERMKDLRDGWEAVADAPVFGHGTGCASSRWQPHNQWVAIWLDLGVGGLLLYTGTLLFLTARCVLSGGKGMFAIVPLWAFTIFSQNLVEMAVYWMCAAVVAIVSTKTRFRLVLTRPEVAHPALSPQT